MNQGEARSEGEGGDRSSERDKTSKEVETHTERQRRVCETERKSEQRDSILWMRLDA